MWPNRISNKEAKNGIETETHKKAWQDFIQNRYIKILQKHKRSVKTNLP